MNGKAIAAGELDGFVKTVFDGKTGALIGAHMIGHEVTEMIQGFVLAMTPGGHRGRSCRPPSLAHPTMSEAMHEASLDAYGKVLHTRRELRFVAAPAETHSAMRAACAAIKG